MEISNDRTSFTIRRAEPSDYEAVARMFAQPRVIWGTLQVPFPSDEYWRKRMAEPPDGYYGLVACAGEEVVGELGLLTFPNAPRRRHVGKMFMAVRDDWQGKGAGTALMQALVDIADKWLNLLRIELEVFTDNEAAIHLYEKFGFVREGKLTCFAFRDGQYVDGYTMARLRDW